MGAQSDSASSRDRNQIVRMSAAVPGVKKIKKVTKTTTKKGDGGETMVETVTRVTSETTGSGLGDNIINDSFVSQENFDPVTKDKDLEYEILFCHQCDDSLAGHRYVLREDHPFCIKCYENVFANNCDECGKVIGIDSKDLSYKKKHWHESCFKCSKCKTSLVDKQIGSTAALATTPSSLPGASSATMSSRRG